VLPGYRVDESIGKSLDTLISGASLYLQSWHVGRADLRRHGCATLVTRGSLVSRLRVRQTRRGKAMWRNKNSPSTHSVYSAYLLECLLPVGLG